MCVCVCVCVRERERDCVCDSGEKETDESVGDNERELEHGSLAEGEGPVQLTSLY